jgi:hypothetical protein
MKSNIIPKGMHCVFATGDKDFLPRANGRRFLLLAASSAATIAAAFDNAAGWKKDADGKLALDADGNPIYVNSAGQESSVKGDTISNLNAEAKQHRTAKENAEKELAKYRTPDGKLLDPETAIKAVDTVGKIDAKTLIDAGKVDEVKAQIEGAYKTQLTEKDNAIAERDQRINAMTIDGVFKGSDFIANRVAMPRDFFEAAMRGNFKVEDGKVTAYDRAGNRLMSKKNVGDYADAEEALELLVDTHPQKDTILKAPAAGGSGNGGNGGSRGGGNVMKRADFDNMSVGEKASVGQKVAAGEMQIVD